MVLSGLLLSTSGWLAANVGESVEEVLRRYGKENLYVEPMSSVVKPWTEPDPKLIVPRWFLNGRIHTSVTFFGGKSVMEEYAVVRGDLSQKQIKDYLAAYAEGNTWRLVEKKEDEMRWVRGDGKLVAWKHRAPPGLRFTVSDYSEIIEKDREERKRRTEGPTK